MVIVVMPDTMVVGVEVRAKRKELFSYCIHHAYVCFLHGGTAGKRACVLIERLCTQYEDARMHAAVGASSTTATTTPAGFH